MPPVAEMIRIAHEGGVGRIHQVAIREHREPFYPKVGDWNRFNANTGGTLVEKCCHYFNLMDFILERKAAARLRLGRPACQPPRREDTTARPPDILDSAYVIVEYPSGARASLDLCMFAENSVDNEHVMIVGAEGKLESLLPSGVLRYGRREDWGRRAVWGQPSGTAKGVAVRQIRDTNIKYLGQHFGASYIEHQKFAHAVRNGLAPEIPLEEGLRAVATGLAAHQSIDEGRVVALCGSAAGRLVTGEASGRRSPRAAAAGAATQTDSPRRTMTAAPTTPALELRAGALRLALRPDLGGAIAGFWHDTTPILRSCEPAESASLAPVGVLSDGAVLESHRLPPLPLARSRLHDGSRTSNRATRIRCMARSGSSRGA